MKSILIESERKSDLDIFIELSSRLGLKSNIILDDEDEEKALLNAMTESNELLNENDKENFIKSLKS